MEDNGPPAPVPVSKIGSTLPLEAKSTRFPFGVPLKVVKEPPSKIRPSLSTIEEKTVFSPAPEPVLNVPSNDPSEFNLTTLPTGVPLKDVKLPPTMIFITT